MASKAVGEAFADRPALLEQLSGFLDYYSQARAATNYQAPDLAPIVDDIASYICDLKTQNQQAVEEPTAKRRKLNGGETNGTHEVPEAAPKKAAASGGSFDVLAASWSGNSIDGISFVVPQRKKYTLQISPNKKEGIRALNATSKTAEFGIPWASIAHILRLPVPEKAAASHNYCVFPKGGDGLAGDKTAEGYETMVWSAADAKKKNQEDVATESESLLAALRDVKAKVVEPTESEFVSAAVNPMRKTEKQYHVKAFRGSKEGYLFFLPTGIAFVFKKPLLFFAFDAIQSVSYTSVLSRTFNLNIAAIPAGSPADKEPMEVEFSMLDQADFAALDEYVKRHSLQDASMAAERRAKKYNVNKLEEGEEAGEGELQKAEQEAGQIADDDDDEEDDENFDPGSEGESEGEGDSSEDEDGGDGGGDGDGGDVMDEDDEGEGEGEL